MPINVEIKAKCQQANDIEALLKAKNARYIGEDHQVDTYFNVKNGRLKLREGSIENNLIHYQRSNQEGPKKSVVALYGSTPNSTLKEVLTRANGVKIVVDKLRKIFFIDNIKEYRDEKGSIKLSVEKYIKSEVEELLKTEKKGFYYSNGVYVCLIIYNWKHGAEDPPQPNHLIQ